MYPNRRATLAAALLAAMVFAAPPIHSAEGDEATAPNPLWSDDWDDAPPSEIDEQDLGPEPPRGVEWLPLREGDERTARIQEHLPQQLRLDEDALIPIGPRLAWLAYWASLRASASDFAGARDTYERAIGLGGERVANWRGLGRMRVYVGDTRAAEAAFLAALDVAESADTPDATTLSEIHRELGELYILMGFPGDAVPQLEKALVLQPRSGRPKSLLALALAGASGGEVPADLASRVVLWPPPRTHKWRASLESSLNATLERAPKRVRHSLAAGSSALNVRWLLGALAALLTIFSVLRKFSKTADLTVVIEFPSELEGLFAVRIAKRRGSYRRPLHGADPGGGRQKSSRTSHCGVSRETQFMQLRPGRYYVTIHGSLRNPETGEPLVEPYEEHSIDIASAEPHRIEFDVSPAECPVDVSVCWDNRPATDIGVVARGLPQSLRYATSGSVRLRLPMGLHTIVVGSGDRVAEREVDVRSFQPTAVEIDLAGAENLVFKGCPPAVESYLHGDLSGSARALERDGHASVAHLMLARLHTEQGHTERAAEQLESAGHTLEAAELRESLSDFQRAADLFLDSGEARRAAETYRTAGDLDKAGELYESLEDFAAAADCFKQSGAVGALVGVLERSGKFFEAAEVAIEHEDRAGSIRLLQQVGRGDPTYLDACEQLVDAFEREGHTDLAANKLEELILARGAMKSSGDLRSRQADLLAEGEEPERALEILEELRRREPTYPHIASRIESLRKRVSSRRSENVDAAPSTASFVAEQRYEIIEEIGRGGMGLIYKARDRRLDRIVALKRLPENLREHPKALQLFLNEAQAAARLNHPNIVTVYDTDQEDGSFFITMELLEGLPLNTVLKKRGRLGPRDTARIGTQIARGLQYAHERQVVHRDIKTANLFLTQDKVMKIMDFGLAKMIEEVRRGTTVIGGTPYYMAPEQAVGDRVDLRADLYSFGITLYELVTGQVPFRQGDVNFHHRHTAPEDPRKVVAGIPDALAQLILRLIEKDPAARCSSAAEVEQQLNLLIG